MKEVGSPGARVEHAVAGRCGGRASTSVGQKLEVPRVQVRHLGTWAWCRGWPHAGADRSRAHGPWPELAGMVRVSKSIEAQLRPQKERTELRACGASEARGAREQLSGEGWPDEAVTALQCMLNVGCGVEGMK